MKKIVKIQTVDEFFLKFGRLMLPTKNKLNKNIDFRFLHFWLFFKKKQLELTRNEENCHNPNRLVKFSEIWYEDASQQKKIQQFFGFFGL